jgi:Icc-related predicted phosphoesterase
MKIALFSDLHSEFVSGSNLQHFLAPMLKCDADVCVLAGDIASGRDNVKKVLRIFADAYDQVVYLPGNHEYYGSSIAVFDTLEMTESNIHILNPGIVEIRGVTFIGATLWTNFRNDVLAEMAARSYIADFTRIKGFTPLDAKNIHSNHLQYIKMMYENTPGKKVIVTHFLPAEACVSERFRDGNLLNNYFANNLDSWIGNMSDTTWLFGHTHDSMDLMLGDTRLVCNPYGYINYETNNGFDFNKVIDV